MSPLSTAVSSTLAPPTSAQREVPPQSPPGVAGGSLLPCGDSLPAEAEYSPLAPVSAESYPLPNDSTSPLQFNDSAPDSSVGVVPGNFQPADDASPREVAPRVSPGPEKHSSPGQDACCGEGDAVEDEHISALEEV